MIVDREIIRLEEVSIIKLTLLNATDIVLSNVVYTSRYDSNLISFSQLREVGIPYYNYPKSMILKKAKNIIGLAQQKKNLYILDIKDNINKIMITQRRG